MLWKIVMVVEDFLDWIGYDRHAPTDLDSLRVRIASAEKWVKATEERAETDGYAAWRATFADFLKLTKRLLNQASALTSKAAKRAQSPTDRANVDELAAATNQVREIVKRLERNCDAASQLIRPP